MTFVFTGFKCKVIAVFKAESRTVTDQESRLHITVHNMAQQARCRSFTVGSSYGDGCISVHEIGQENMIPDDRIARFKSLFYLWMIVFEGIACDIDKAVHYILLVKIHYFYAFVPQLVFSKDFTANIRTPDFMPEIMKHLGKCTHPCTLYPYKMIFFHEFTNLT